MNTLFSDPNFSFECLRVLGESVYGGGDIKEVLLTASRIKDGDTESWYQEWNRTAGRVEQRADESLKRGHTVSAREAYLRASNYYRTAEFFLHLNIGQTDPCANVVYEKSVACFLKAARLLPYKFEDVKIPYEGTTLPGYFFRTDDQPRRTIILHGGYDSTGEEMFFSHVPAAMDRGYNCLIFEGPGQGRVIRRQNLPFRPDWECAVTPVVDYALTRPEIDPDGMVLIGHSLGGYLAPRAAAFEHRLAACIAVDGLYSFAPSERSSVDISGFSLEQINDMLVKMMNSSLNLRWAFSQGVWTMHAESLLDYIQKMDAYTMKGIADKITCPTLVCDAEDDQFFRGQPRKLYDALICPKTYLVFTAEDGGEAHCHEGAFRLLNQKVFDWLDEVFVPVLA